MRKYFVNVHHDMVATVEVEAINETQALEMAEEIAEGVAQDKFQCVGVESCVTNVDEDDFDEQEFADEITDKVMYINPEANREYVEKAVIDLTSDVQYFDSLQEDEIYDEVMALAEKLQEEDEKLFERCKGENF